uniref:2-oxoacid:acceptor oxidoreductase subunit alpha n=1 Tax=candidate division WOR-3 bacterium TaxID=2052148 RepID=A0A7C4CCG5_UNCW3
MGSATGWLDWRAAGSRITIVTDVTVVVAGEAGLGVQSAGTVLTRQLVRQGYHVFAYPNVMSRIRGGHNFTSIRVSERPKAGIRTQANVVLALDEQAAQERKADLIEGGVLVYDSPAEPMIEAGRSILPVPMTAIAKRLGGGPPHAGVVGLGVLCALNSQPLRALQAVLKEQFEARGAEAGRLNAACAQAGFEYGRERFRGVCPCLIPELASWESRLLLTGAQAIGLGALAAGVQFYAGYPMSPSTAILEYLAGKAEEFGIVVEQVEDEVSVINMVAGAAFAGARAMTATSGGGFALMVEGIGLAGMAELPLVVVVGMRPGPATGFPTRTEQAELLYAADCSQDEFPRVVLAPGTAEQAFYATVRAFGLAQRFQSPVIVLTDQFLLDSSWTVGNLQLPIANLQLAGRQSGAAYSFRRFEITESGVSPFLRPGTREQLVMSMGGEHDESGLGSEDAGNRVRMMEKRMRKLEGLRQEAAGLHEFPGRGGATVVVCFGSVFGPLREAVEILAGEGADIGMVHISDIVPFPAKELAQRLAGAKTVVCVEQNSTGQLARLVRRETGFGPDEIILRFDGRPFTGDGLAERLRPIAGGAG